MKTPRIEEMVNGYSKEAMLFKVGEGEMERHQRLQNYVVEALTEAHQAGRGEAVEKIIVHIQRKGYDRQFAEDFIKYDTIKALQDNK